MAAALSPPAGPPIVSPVCRVSVEADMSVLICSSPSLSPVSPLVSVLPLSPPPVPVAAPCPLSPGKTGRRKEGHALQPLHGVKTGRYGDTRRRGINYRLENSAAGSSTWKNLMRTRLSGRSTLWQQEEGWGTGITKGGSGKPIGRNDLRVIAQAGRILDQRGTKDGEGIGSGGL
ncbi:hypothetical protein BDZ91DRAFT_747659, partial [Kalaharituber pfeilii]